MIAMYFKAKYRPMIKNYFSKYNTRYNEIIFKASEGSVYFVRDEKVYCETNRLFKARYPKVKIIDPEEIYGEY